MGNENTKVEDEEYYMGGDSGGYSATTGGVSANANTGGVSVNPGSYSSSRQVAYSSSGGGVGGAQLGNAQYSVGAPGYNANYGIGTGGASQRTETVYTQSTSGGGGVGFNAPRADVTLPGISTQRSEQSYTVSGGGYSAAAPRADVNYSLPTIGGSTQRNEMNYTVSEGGINRQYDGATLTLPSIGSTTQRTETSYTSSGGNVPLVDVGYSGGSIGYSGGTTGYSGGSQTVRTEYQTTADGLRIDGAASPATTGRRLIRVVEETTTHHEQDEQSEHDSYEANAVKTRENTTVSLGQKIQHQAVVQTDSRSEVDKLIDMVMQKRTGGQTVTTTTQEISSPRQEISITTPRISKPDMTYELWSEKKEELPVEQDRMGNYRMIAQFVETKQAERNEMAEVEEQRDPTPPPPPVERIERRVVIRKPPPIIETRYIEQTPTPPPTPPPIRRIVKKPPKIEYIEVEQPTQKVIIQRPPKVEYIYEDPPPERVVIKAPPRTETRVEYHEPPPERVVIKAPPRKETRVEYREVKPTITRTTKVSKPKIVVHEEEPPKMKTVVEKRVGEPKTTTKTIITDTYTHYPAVEVIEKKNGSRVVRKSSTKESSKASNGSTRTTTTKVSRSPQPGTVTRTTGGKTTTTTRKVYESSGLTGVEENVDLLDDGFSFDDDSNSNEGRSFTVTKPVTVVQDDIPETNVYKHYKHGTARRA